MFMTHIINEALKLGTKVLVMDFPYCSMEDRIGRMDSPNSDNEYSTQGGTFTLQIIYTVKFECYISIYISMVCHSTIF